MRFWTFKTGFCLTDVILKTSLTVYSCLTFSLAIRQFFSFQNNPKNLDLSYKTDLDLWDCLGKVKTHMIANFIGLI